MKSITLIAFCFLFANSVAQTQQAVPTAGGNALGSGGSVSYTVGQVFYTSVTTNNGKVYQGVQQPYEISEISATEKAMGINLQWGIYPNPVSHFLYLTIEASDFTGCLYQLYDNNGKVIRQQKVHGSTTEIDMSGLTPAVYFLKIKAENRELKTIKIIKH
jgi:hypothetical protein